jgi:hypothetical protein
MRGYTIDFMFIFLKASKKLLGKSKKNVATQNGARTYAPDWCAWLGAGAMQTSHFCPN